jgi:hypothetical protein
MMGRVLTQGNLFGGDCQHLDYVGRTTFYGWLAAEGGRVYADEDFRGFYVLDNGRKSVPPSRMIRMVLLQWYDKVSDDEGEAGTAQTLGDCAYGTASNRRAFLDAGRELVAKQPALHNDGRFTKEDLPRDAATGARTCPAGHTVAPRMRSVSWRGGNVHVPFYRWPAAVCAQCPRQSQCLAPPKNTTPRPHGRTLSEHPEEGLLAQARAQQRSPSFHAAYRERQTVEHRLARLMQLGSRQARYFGRAKTELQWILASTVADSTLAARQQKSPKTANRLGMRLQRMLTRIMQDIQNVLPRIVGTPSLRRLARLHV